jgi:hypothetical protein
MADKCYRTESFYQYQDVGTQERKGHLLSFTAPARDILLWAGIPRKGWTLRALYQRLLTPKRVAEIRGFLDPSEHRAQINLSPTAITVAIIHPEINIPRDPGEFRLCLPVPDSPDRTKIYDELAKYSRLVRVPHLLRLDDATRALITNVVSGGCSSTEAKNQLPADDYVALFVLDLADLERDPETFLSERNLEDPSDRMALLDALFELSKPALVVDGQHRVHGAASLASHDVSFLVCAIPRCSWEEQAFQFVVINEESQPVDTTILYDIFGSSLTRAEADSVRLRLGASGRNVERRIAAVIAYRQEASPFANMVRLNVKDLPSDVKPFLSPRLIVDLIEGGRSTAGFRTDQGFYRWLVEPSFHDSDKSMWNDWTTGRWRDYFYAFWDAIRDYFNIQGRALWNPVGQTNLTKGVSLRALQDVLLQQMTSKAKEIDDQANELRVVGVQEEKIQRLREKHVLPTDPRAFKTRVHEDYLKGFPHAFFEKHWVRSLDTAEGIDILKTVMRETWSSYVGHGGTRRYPYWKNTQMFVTPDPSKQEGPSKQADPSKQVGPTKKTDGSN